LNFANRSQIALEDYECNRDVQARLMMADWKRPDVELVDAILQSPQVVLLEQLAEQLERDVTQLEPSLEKVAPTGLFQRRGATLVVDKDLRRYYETQLRRFEERFEPTLDYLQGLLRHIPLQTLLSWYSIPRSADQVFDALMERFLATPKVFRTHVLEQGYDNPTLVRVAQMAYEAPDWRVSKAEVCTQLGLSHEQFQELALFLEFSFLACLSYVPKDDGWEEVITPFYEWREYLQFLRTATPGPLPEERLSPEPMAKLSAEKATQRYRAPEAREQYPWRSRQVATDRNRRLVENALEGLADGRWVLFEQFLSGLTAPIGQTTGVTLVRQGKRFFYARPRYNLEETDFIRQMVLEWLVECGITQVGTLDGSTCFRLTDIGISLLGFTH
jgi:predicted transcriptional regulator